ncbi:MAG: aromatic ring-hydroxylating dioxygenase subunit alpha [Roseovarius sp.]|nr:aromatic ring-hydroxylating dioxygenase subunit alpha [Roseovarius sp.]MCY4292173.1 aromatic ring-hydroxylating dioxygenase subunit alpha [Roseovarius sp.]MCY4314491.1 aromatic ring-hydroxylating dioxygenase subunit alpha [Roseovarius sp.]
MNSHVANPRANNIPEMREELKTLAALPSDRPMGLPGIFYTSHEYFKRECATILRNGWHCVGRIDEIPNPGDYLTIQILNEPLLVVRVETGDICAYSNICRHRGMPLAEGDGNANRFACSYHGWVYGLNGSLFRAPRMDNAGFDLEKCRLHTFPLQTWQGFIYISLVANPPEFGKGCENLEKVAAPFESDTFRFVHKAREIWKTNWKCLVENFMDSYHLSVVHPQTLSYTPTRLSNKYLSGYGFTSYCANYPEGKESRSGGARGLSDEERGRSTLFARFPTHLASQAASLLISFSVLPVSPCETEVKWTMSAYGDDVDDDAIAQRISLWEEVNREDREKLELLQVSLNSFHAESGPLAADDYEGTIRDFVNWLAAEDAACSDY